MDVLVAGPQLRFDFRDLLTAASDSRALLLARVRNLFEGPTIAFESRFLPAQGLPALNNDVHVLRIQFYPTARPFGDFGCGERRATTEERFVDDCPAFNMVQDRAPHEVDRLLRGMIVLL